MTPRAKSITFRQTILLLHLQFLDPNHMKLPSSPCLETLISCIYFERFYSFGFLQYLIPRATYSRSNLHRLAYEARRKRIKQLQNHQRFAKNLRCATDGRETVLSRNKVSNSLDSQKRYQNGRFKANHTQCNE